MTRTAEATLDIVRDKHVVGLEWLLSRIADSTADAIEAAHVADEIHRTLVNAGWRHSVHAVYGTTQNMYEQPLGDRRRDAHPPYHSGGFVPLAPGETPQGLIGLGIEAERTGNAMDASAAPTAQTAPDILAAAARCIEQRAATRDLPAERSMARTVTAFNALAGHQLSERDGWLFMAILKAARATAGSHNPDDYIDGAAYFALAGESAGAGEQKK